ncbi:hypothetical protein [Trichormus variabilis]|uniref:Uncharacterized protein n=1 Tax=Trichormus variabilis SAG 1403-4b TaxID=447716 RepID=A0A3S1INT1_ANAVA|nr:hypothetical protein [Trichormus variabilis]MBD2627256.1 hypothetical protein [Trichormus variabilis FACHB-164]RUS99947.1 hypothetical protein DSM107003_05310 [Trichormus variabilis SAG 1403-4b]
MNPWMFSPDMEDVTTQPTKADPDYQTRFTQRCILTYSDNTITSIFEGTGIPPAQHPLERQFIMLRVPMTECGQCQSPQVSVIYARFDTPLEDPRPGEVVCAYEVFCHNCNFFTYRQYTP